MVLLTLGFACRLVFPSLQAVTRGDPNVADFGQGSDRAPTRGTQRIVGVVVNEHGQPVARAQVQAFSLRTAVPEVQPQRTVPFSVRASGSASTDVEGRFQISGLETGEYLVAAEAAGSLRSLGAPESPIYATTFYPSAIAYQAAERVATGNTAAAPIQIVLVQVRGVRVAGAVVSPTAAPTSGMEVRLFRRFGDFGSDAGVAVVGANGTFEIPRVAPGWYRLTVGVRSTPLNVIEGEFATTLIEVQNNDIGDLSLVMGRGASITGRVVAEPGAGISPIGLRVGASLTPEAYSSEFQGISAMVAADWSFRMTGLTGDYRFGVTGDRTLVQTTRVMVDGAEAPDNGGVELKDGTHEVVVFVGPRERPSTIDRTLSTRALVDQFKGEKVFFRTEGVCRRNHQPWRRERSPVIGRLVESRRQARTGKCGAHFRRARRPAWFPGHHRYPDRLIRPASRRHHSRQLDSPGPDPFRPLLCRPSAGRPTRSTRDPRPHPVAEGYGDQLDRAVGSRSDR